MKAYYDIEQGSLEWHRIRWAKVGGTLSSGLLVDSDTLALDIVSQLTEDYQDDDSFKSKDMIRGSELEPVALANVCHYAGIEFRSVGWIDSDIPRIGISPDGISPDETVMVEIKCPGRKKHIETILGGVIPKDNIAQCLHYFTVNPKLERFIFCSFRPENKLRPSFIVELTRESEIDMGKTKKTKVMEDRGKGLKEYVSTVPLIQKVSEWVDDARISAIEMNKQVDEILERLEF